MVEMMKFPIIKFYTYCFWVIYGISFCIWLAIIAYLWLGFKLIEGIKWMFFNHKLLAIIMIKSIKNIFLNPQKIGILLILLFTVILLLAIFPVTHNFEGQLIVQEMNFTYVGNNSNKLFLNSIRGINQISVRGTQTLTLTGKFASKTYPQLNKLNKLTIELPNEKSNLSISPANPQKTSQIEMELRLQPNTTVKGLNYNSYDDKKHKVKVNYLSLSLQTETEKTAANLLQMQLGDQFLKLQLEDYRLPNLKLPTNSNNSDSELEVIFKPDIQEIGLHLPQTTDLLIDLPEPTTREYSQWFRGDLAVKNVQFYQIEKTGVDVKDDLFNSTILAGQIRMAGQEHKIEKNQFLITEEPGVKLLRNIQINPESPQGLEVRIAGETKRLQIGLDARFPVVTIQATLLDKFLARDTIIALISFSAASFSYVLYWLLEQWAKSNQKS
ncbi:hypothetical protein [Argonema galeatum]|uniref:hypothetical protein n=1 Tax=Argonema galeatum TaxID=2942762 RepID=UPI002010CC1B|nr:hypothetical protein [Argonema galeatum]MCL1468298.1 hypothetical protein [Argonema galeatum A003/A1]